ncbi:protein translocase subunit secF [Caminicella sporogenes DSM 14501]|uniref:Protein-export membrane protein SecF n=1 Tax=Caminicella sporogenes DSM 14501 TaxID=1121266 RepID=A0A1M6M0W9_9FIRM|nr:protein translocase subunit SecF [Caminicella sporogenes]RKD28023.1 protein-export membrane protein SecF [Caminicella sporogenes]SHJ77142.1 protein translocase subunit secF [Caminicella sporogenes DSM 14501]
MKIAENYKIWFSISLAVMIAGLVMAIVSGVNLGIDFTGGTMMQIDIGKTFDLKEIKEITSKYQLDADIIYAGQNKQEVIIKTKKDLSNKDRMEIFNEFKQKFNLKDEAFRQAQQFGPSVGKEIRNKAMLSIIIASIGMLMYITYRFTFKFGVSAIIALIHDVLIVLSIYAILKIPVNNPFIAAILTIVGYSINDTIVVFDRVRENVKRMKKANFFEIANQSIKQTLSRSINTSLTTLLVIGSLFVLGVESVREFSLPLLAGILTGTYSSIFIASPIWALWKTYEKRRNSYRPS